MRLTSAEANPGARAEAPAGNADRPATVGAEHAAAASGVPNFYGRRYGRRIRPWRSTLVDSLLPQLGISLPTGAPTPLDLAALFPRPVRAVWLEVGFGAGEHLIAQARAHPEVGYIGCEPFMNGVATVLAELDRQPADNIRLFTDDARLLIARLPEASLERVFVLFPDPWPKARHHRRRFISAAMVEQLGRIIAPGGELRIATDHMDYARWTLSHLCGSAAGSSPFQWTARHPEDWRRPPADWIATRYQQKAEAAGASPVFLSFRRRHAATATRKSLVPASGQDI